MNNVINKFFLIGNKFMSGMCLKQPRFVNNAIMRACHLLKIKKQYEKFEETEDVSHIYQNE